MKRDLYAEVSARIVSPILQLFDKKSLLRSPAPLGISCTSASRSGCRVIETKTRYISSSSANASSYLSTIDPFMCSRCGSEFISSTAEYGRNEHIR